MATYVVTGGAGFIGARLVAELDQRGHDAIVVDTLGRDEKWRNIRPYRLADLVAPDRALDAIAAHPGKIAGVLHMGAVSSTVETDVDLIVESNFRTSCRWWQWCAEAGVPLVYASSAATYGDGSAGFVDSDDDRHLARLEPLNAYGWSKHLFDRWALERQRRGAPCPPSWAGLKFFNVYGPGEAHKGGQRSTALQIWEQVAAGGPVRLFKSYRPDYEHGGQQRDFVHVDDCVAIALWLAARPGTSGLFNVGTGAARSFRDLAQAVMTAADRPTEITYIDMPETLRAKYQYFTAADMGKLGNLGCPVKPRSIEAGAADYVRFLTGNALR